MNRREFTLLLGTSIVGLEPLRLFNSDSSSNEFLKSLRRFWFSNFNQTPESYLDRNKIIDRTTFKLINNQALKEQQIMEFEGVYYSHIELAVLASLAQIVV